MSMEASITCQELVELLTAYVEGELSPQDHDTVERHLAACGGCDTVLEQFRQTIALTGMIGEGTLTPAHRDTLLRAFSTWKGDRSRG
jgi:anti-sigma factor RsiW